MSHHPIHDLDDLIHQRVRLGVLAMLSRVERLEFTRIRDDLGTTDGNLSRHLRALDEADLVTMDRQAGGRPRTWISVTEAGQAALAKEVAALRAILDQLDG